MTTLHEVLIHKRKDIKPIWFMRQAGRYLPEYRVLNNLNFMDKVTNSNLVTEITLQPVQRYDLDAAIIFSDILLIPWAMGQDLEFSSQGPQLGEFKEKIFFDTPDSQFTKKLLCVYDGIVKTRRRLSTEKSLIGFVAAPYTLMHYMFDPHTLDLQLKHMDAVRHRLTHQIIQHVVAQIQAGADVIQIFDSHAGELLDQEVEDWCIKPHTQIIDHIKEKFPHVPVISFAKGLKPAQLVKFAQQVQPHGLSIDYTQDPAYISTMLPNQPIQGGLDPKILLGNEKHMLESAKKYITAFKDHPYVFNLGHGILKQTKPITVQKLIAAVREWSK